jgi:hypothetical protein
VVGDLKYEVDHLRNKEVIVKNDIILKFKGELNLKILILE